MERNFEKNFVPPENFHMYYNMRAEWGLEEIFEDRLQEIVDLLWLYPIITKRASDEWPMTTQTNIRKPCCVSGEITYDEKFRFIDESERLRHHTQDRILNLHVDEHWVMQDEITESGFTGIIIRWKHQKDTTTGLRERIYIIQISWKRGHIDNALFMIHTLAEFDDFSDEDDSNWGASGSSSASDNTAREDASEDDDAGDNVSETWSERTWPYDTEPVETEPVETEPVETEPVDNAGADAAGDNASETWSETTQPIETTKPIHIAALILHLCHLNDDIPLGTRT
jgi:hypothetical protein